MATFIVSGVSGTGKSTMRQRLATLLPDDKFAIHDIDERGVPPDTPESWRATETGHWLSVAAANAEKGRSTIVVGTIHPTDITDSRWFSELPSVRICLLEASRECLRSRLLKRYSVGGAREWFWRQAHMAPEAFIAENEQFRPHLRALFESSGCVWFSIDTSSLTEEETATRLVAWVEGDAQDGAAAGRI